MATLAQRIKELGGKATPQQVQGRADALGKDISRDSARDFFVSRRTPSITGTSGGLDATTLDAEEFAGTEPSAEVTSSLNLTLDDIEPWETPEVPDTNVDDALARADAGTNSLDEMISNLRAINADRLKGKIPGDVADIIRENSAEAALASGTGGDSPSARALQARDLGRTSLDIQDQAIATEAGLTQLQGELVKFRENRYQFSEQLAEQRRQFTEASRQFGAANAVDRARISLAENELLLRQDMFNATNNMALVEMISNLVADQSRLQTSLALGDKSDSVITRTYDDLILQISGVLDKAGAATRGE